MSETAAPQELPPHLQMQEEGPPPAHPTAWTPVKREILEMASHILNEHMDFNLGHKVDDAVRFLKTHLVPERRGWQPPWSTHRHRQYREAIFALGFHKDEGDHIVKAIEHLQAKHDALPRVVQCPEPTHHKQHGLHYVVNILHSKVTADHSFPEALAIVQRELGDHPMVPPPA